MILMSVLMAIFYFGGWLSPFEGIPVVEAWFAWVPGMAWLLLKSSCFLFLYFWFRATFPRFRYDQLMRLGWKVYIPVTLVWIMVVAVLVKGQWGPWFP